MTKQPDRLSIEKSERKLYDNLDNEIFAGKTRKEQFLFALAVGFKHKLKRPLETREGVFLAKDLHPEDQMILDVVAIYDTGSIDVLTNQQQVFNIAEEYAHAGIRLIYDNVNSGQPGSYFKKMELDLIGMLKPGNN